MGLFETRSDIREYFANYFTIFFWEHQRICCDEGKTEEQTKSPEKIHVEMEISHFEPFIYSHMIDLLIIIFFKAFLAHLIQSIRLFPPFLHEYCEDT